MWIRAGNAPLSTAIQTRDGIQIIKPEMEALAQEIAAREIDVLVIDPFVSSHQVSENDNGAIDLVAKGMGAAGRSMQLRYRIGSPYPQNQWRGSDHGKAHGVQQRFWGAARSGRVLNKMSNELKAEAGGARRSGHLLCYNARQGQPCPSGQA